MAVENLSHSPTIENRATFINRLSSLPWEKREIVMSAYDIAKSAHRPQKREGGNRYFEHPRSVALILMDECNLLHPSILQAALLHDAMEDTSIFGSYKGMQYSEWQASARLRISKQFDEETADMIINLTKPKVDGHTITTKEQAMSIYLQNLIHSSPETLLIKMADRLHNLRTIADTDEEKQKRKIAETTHVYFPIFQRAHDKYPSETSYLLNQMQLAIHSSPVTPQGTS